MAKRINAIPTNASSPAGDDYFPLDGTTNGTRKLSAGYIAALINPRAPRQGLVFDGSGTPPPLAIPVPAIFTIFAIVNLVSFGSSGRVIAGSGNSFEFGVSAAGLPYIFNGTTIYTASAPIVAGVDSQVAYTRTGTSGVFYVNGTAAGTVTDNNTYVAINNLGGTNATSGMLGKISGFVFETRALSAGEITQLYQGAPAATDYNNASSTALTSASNWSNNSMSSISGASTTGFTATFGGGGEGYVQQSYTGRNFGVGQKFLVSFNLTVNSGATPNFIIFGDGSFSLLMISGFVTLTPGANSFIVALSAGKIGQATMFFHSGFVTNFTISGFSITPLGATVALDPAQPGAGLQWLDASGNRAHLTLPTTGVTWALPNVSGVIVVEATVTGTGNLQFGGASLIDINRRWRIQSLTLNCTSTQTASVGNVSGGTQYASAASLAIGDNDITPLSRFPATANLWINHSQAGTTRLTMILAPV